MEAANNNGSRDQKALSYLISFTGTVSENISSLKCVGNNLKATTCCHILISNLILLFHNNKTKNKQTSKQRKIQFLGLNNPQQEKLSSFVLFLVLF